MEIPSKIRIGGQDIDVTIKDRLYNGNLGTICLGTGELLIAENFNEGQQSESSRFQTFIHEVIHGVLDSMGESELSQNERFVNSFASLLVDVIYDIVEINKQQPYERKVIDKLKKII